MKREVTSLDFGLWMAEKRKKKKLTQMALGNLLHVQQHTVCRWETGETYPKLDMVEQICKILGAELVVREKGNDE